MIGSFTSSIRENLLKLIFQNVAIANIGDASG
jgi:hypothetical protein